MRQGGYTITVVPFLAPPQRQSFEVLLVEDNLADVRLLQHFLCDGRRQCRVTPVMDGMEASDFLMKRGKHEDAARPDLILLDLNLPRKTGHELLVEIKANPALRPIPVVIFSSSTSDTDVRAAYASGANAYMVKPTGLDEMQNVVTSMADYWMKTATLPTRKSIRRTS